MATRLDRLARLHTETEPPFEFELRYPIVSAV
jgi:hypothetical protein